MNDKIVENLIKMETKRQSETLDLIASENIASQQVREALGSILINKYSEGYAGKRYYAGNKIVDQIELLAQKRARQAFKLNKNWHVNVQPYSGSPANMAVYCALLKPNDKIMGMSLPFGGHLTHGWKVNFSGKFYKTAQYRVKKDGYLDYGEIRKLAKKEKPKIIIAGATAYSRIIDFKKFNQIAKEVNAYFMADISHIAGLITAGIHPSPFPYADIVTTTTHKTLRGPRGAMVLSNGNPSTPLKAVEKTAENIPTLIDRAVIPGFQGGPHNHQTAAIAVALEEAMQPEFKTYAAQVVTNAKVLADELIPKGYELVTGGTETHLLLINLNNKNVTGKQAESALGKAGITVNKNTIPHDPRKPFDPSGIRMGTPALTTRGMKEEHMKLIAEFIDKAITSIDDEAQLNRIHDEVKELCKSFPLPA